MALILQRADSVQEEVRGCQEFPEVKQKPPFKPKPGYLHLPDSPVKQHCKNWETNMERLNGILLALVK
ncbi:hypothetical protein FKM82_031156 [Ascaphus truei]